MKILSLVILQFGGSHTLSHVSNQTALMGWIRIFWRFANVLTDLCRFSIIDLLLISSLPLDYPCPSKEGPALPHFDAVCHSQCKRAGSPCGGLPAGVSSFPSHLPEGQGHTSQHTDSSEQTSKELP